MGLAEPRKRLKLSHDPNNTAWTSQPSFGSTLMQKSGWTPGTALGASSVPIPVSQSTASQVKIRVKDDMLGLGASLKSKDLQNQRTGLDAFQGLLGRLNAKDAGELKAVETKIENRKLEMFARGRWGGMMFVPGGLLVQEDPKQTVEVVKTTPEEDDERLETTITSTPNKEKKRREKEPNETPAQRAIRKAESSQRKQEKRARKEARRLKKLHMTDGNTPMSTSASASASASETPDLTETSTGTSTPVQIPEGEGSVSVTSITQARLKNGRHILRGRNIQAKKMAFSDARGLDQIFMKRQEREQAV